MVENSLLINELALGNRLNNSIQSQQRADFVLLLSMLSDNVCEFSEFTLPRTEVHEKVTTEESLRHYFQLPPKQALALENLEKISNFNQSQVIQENRLADIILENSLIPLPLAFRDDKNHIHADVYTNVSLHCLNRLKKLKTLEFEDKAHSQISERPSTNSQKSVIERSEMKAKEWLNVLQQTIVASPLIAV